MGKNKALVWLIFVVVIALAGACTKQASELREFPHELGTDAERGGV